MPRWLYFLLIFALAVPLLDLFLVPPLLLFVVTGLGIYGWNSFFVRRIMKGETAS
jgi:hypothetical protein